MAPGSVSKGWCDYMVTKSTIKVVHKNMVCRTSRWTDRKWEEKEEELERHALCVLFELLSGLFCAWHLAQARWDTLTSYLKTRLNDLLTRLHTWQRSEGAGTERMRKLRARGKGAWYNCLVLFLDQQKNFLAMTGFRCVYSEI